MTVTRTTGASPPGSGSPQATSDGPAAEQLWFSNFNHREFPLSPASMSSNQQCPRPYSESP